ncbi:MAG TPA: D-alanyl-D-alanine carboxypeptidase/D-alanyl-D-alanine-endopeptidase [Baekduia sp.]|nr:D-alanyl-D-alanine carboxypeptidase/D-alanyl-D-alanine-endopeptidase [Baekduia sp.]
MRFWRPATAILCGLLAVAFLPSAASAITGPELNASLSKHAAGLGPASGVLVKNVGTNQELFSLRADTQLVPASNQKLFTTATALVRYGAAATLPTTLRVKPGVAVDPATGVLPGDIYLVGGGDPTLNEAGLQQLAAQIRQLGVTHITGAVRPDEFVFDRLRGSFDSRFKVDFDLAGQLSGLAFEHGRSGSAKRAGKRLDALLRATGITLGAKPRTGRAAVDDPVLATIQSPNMERLAEMTNVPSENFIAEMLVKDLGARFGSKGSTAAGLKVMRKTMSDTIGIKPRLVDGSGLSRGNRTTPRQLVNLLDEVDETPAIAAPFAGSLPRIGHEGTVRKRLRGTAAASRCAAKTGTLIGVSSLSGYCTTPSGARIAFSIVANRVNSGGAKKVEDKLVKAIANYDG